MTHLDIEIPKLKDSLLEMMSLVKNQLHKAHEAVKEYDTDIAYEIITNEKRVNAMELKIDMDCENMIALYQPVAIDLRFVMSTYNINSSLERIADNVEGIAKYITLAEHPLNPDMREKLRFDEMFSHTKSMIDDVIYAFETEDTIMGRKIFKRDKLLNEINKQCPVTMVDLFKQYPEDMPLLLHTFSIIKKLERIGDLAKNIAEELIYFIEAKKVKHSKKLKKLSE